MLGIYIMSIFKRAAASLAVLVVADALCAQDATPSPLTALRDGDYAKALGLEIDASGFGMGTRSSRFALLVDDGVVTQTFIEAAPTELKASSAENVLNSL